jgi:stalled ribosome rescue protein Dom34
MQTEEIRKWKQAAMKVLMHLEQSKAATAAATIEERAAILSAVAQWEIALQLSLANRREGISLARMRELLISRVGVSRAILDSKTKILEQLVDDMVPNAVIKQTERLAKATARKLHAAGKAAAKA